MSPVVEENIPEHFGSDDARIYFRKIKANMARANFFSGFEHKVIGINVYHTPRISDADLTRKISSSVELYKSMVQAREASRRFESLMTREPERGVRRHYI